jgi:hypothetical protein
LLEDRAKGILREDTYDLEKAKEKIVRNSLSNAFIWPRIKLMALEIRDLGIVSWMEKESLFGEDQLRALGLYKPQGFQELHQRTSSLLSLISLDSDTTDDALETLVHEELKEYSVACRRFPLQEEELEKSFSMSSVPLLTIKWIMLMLYGVTLYHFLDMKISVDQEACTKEEKGEALRAFISSAPPEDSLRMWLFSVARRCSDNELVGDQRSRQAVWLWKCLKTLRNVFMASFTKDCDPTHILDHWLLCTLHRQDTMVCDAAKIDEERNSCQETLQDKQSQDDSMVGEYRQEEEYNEEIYDPNADLEADAEEELEEEDEDENYFDDQEALHEPFEESYEDCNHPEDHLFADKENDEYDYHDEEEREDNFDGYRPALTVHSFVLERLESMESRMESMESSFNALQAEEMRRMTKIEICLASLANSLQRLHSSVRQYEGVFNQWAELNKAKAKAQPSQQ